MANQDNGRKLSTEDVIHIGMATKDPGAYMFATLVLGLIKLPFVLLGAVFGTIRVSWEEKRRVGLVKKREEELVVERASARAEACERSKEEYTARMEKRKQEFIEREEERKKQEILKNMMLKVTMPEVKAEFGEDLEEIIRGKSAPGYYVDSCLYALELIKTSEVRAVVTERGLSPESLEAKLRELHEQSRLVAPEGGHRLTPRIKKAMAMAGRAAKARFSSEHPSESGSVQVTVLDLFEGALDTEGFVKEIAPVWEHLRRARKGTG